MNALRLHVVIRGAVQGVGFRPFIHRLATGMGLTGWVLNDAHGVLLEVEGEQERLEQFLLRIEPERPPIASIQSLEHRFLDPVGYRSFEIRPSVGGGAKSALIMPDIATCPDCLREIFDPNDRRHRYPFTNCTNCGPRFTIIESLPYDRPNTSMRRFAMCDQCRTEYDNPANRRFHAQPNACSICGPHLELWDPDGNVRKTRDEALFGVASAIRDGAIVALKGIGGFLLLCDARNGKAIGELRRRKEREEKPFALMCPLIATIGEICELSDIESRLLRSPASPIVLLRRTSHDLPHPSVAPGNPCLGVMLPYAPLHHLLMAELGFPVVATSGNRSDEPICIDEREALTRLKGIADFFLVHNRPIVRHVDDPIVRVMAGGEVVLRRARGYAPMPLMLKHPAPPILAVGAHLKNSVALAVGTDIFPSQHIGDLETPQAVDAFERVVGDFQKLYDRRAATVACDAHPDYLSTQRARAMGIPVVAVQHHEAHLLACMAENEIDAPVLGIAWDGTGYGDDGTIWGGEFLRITPTGRERAAHLRTFRLPGGDVAAREPRRSAIGLLTEMGAEWPAIRRAFSEIEWKTLQTMIARGVNAPWTSSAGRLFDGVAAILGVRQVSRYEGQAAMELEFAREGVETEEAYPFAIEGSLPLVVQWPPMVAGILEDLRNGTPTALVAAKFHNTLAEMMVAVARRVGEERVALSGGCFQNRVLTERALERLTTEGFRVYRHQRIPPNDGGIAVGQIMAAMRRQGD